MGFGKRKGDEMSRLSVKKPDELDENQREQYERIRRFRPAGPDGAIGGPFDPWIRSPELARRNVGMGNFLWERTTLQPRIVELAICVTARFWQSNVEWVSHSRKALSNGVSRETLDAVMDEASPISAPKDEQLCYDVCVSLHTEHRLSTALYERAIEGFGERGLAELIAVIGYYTMVSMTLNAFEIQAKGVDAPPFDRPIE